jgi:tetratricopeptide (TPR) repeat protein
MRHWYQEVHRRGLWQATAGFLAAAWVVIEVVDLLTSRGILPDWAFNGALIVLAIGFPIILATAYVQTPAVDGGEQVSTELDATGSATGAAESNTEADSEAPGVASVLTWRNALIGGVAAFALLGLATAGSALFQMSGLGSGPESDALVADRIAVLPFSVRGSPDLDYLGEGIVDLVSAKLDGAGSLTTVDPRAVIGLSRKGRVDVADPEDVGRLATELRAGQYVTGELLEVAGRVQLTAYLHETGDPAGPFQQASAEGTTAEVFDLLDDLVADLLAGSMAKDTDRLQALATLTSGSLDAAKEYLTGEQLMRTGRYRESAAAFDRAIELDSTFALAYYRKSIAADWIDAYDIRSSADRAFEYSDRLSVRDRGLLNALRLRRNGRVVEAEQAFRTQIHVYPDDVEALVQFGETLFHDHQRRGRSIQESMVPFQRVLQLEPGNLIALIHLARLYAISDSTQKLAETAELLAEIAPDSERAREVEALYVHVLADTAGVRSLNEKLLGKPWYYRIYAVLGVDRFARNARAAEDILAARESDVPLLAVNVPIVRLEQGRLDDARAFLAQPKFWDVPSWNVFEALVLTSGLVPPDPARMGSLAERLETMDPEALLSSFWLPPYEDMTPEFSVFVRDYYRALLLIHLDRIPEARAIVDDMARRDNLVGLGTMQRDVELILESEILLRDGDRMEALEVLRSVEYQVPHAITVVPIGDQARSRLVRAELERDLGDIETAKAFLAGLDESWSPWDGMYRSSVYRLMGLIAEDEGHLEEAILNYTRLLDLWQACDPELVPVRDEIEARRNALIRVTG